MTAKVVQSADNFGFFAHRRRVLCHDPGLLFWCCPWSTVLERTHPEETMCDL